MKNKKISEFMQIRSYNRAQAYCTVCVCLSFKYLIYILKDKNKLINGVVLDH